MQIPGSYDQEVDNMNEKNVDEIIEAFINTK